jgi:hypothetical protein
MIEDKYSYKIIKQQPNARHHPRPYASSMRVAVKGRRVHAVVRRRGIRNYVAAAGDSFDLTNAPIIPASVKITAPHITPYPMSG